MRREFYGHNLWLQIIKPSRECGTCGGAGTLLRFWYGDLRRAEGRYQPSLGYSCLCSRRHPAQAWTAGEQQQALVGRQPGLSSNEHAAGGTQPRNVVIIRSCDEPPTSGLVRTWTLHEYNLDRGRDDPHRCPNLRWIPALPGATGTCHCLYGRFQSFVFF